MGFEGVKSLWGVEAGLIPKPAFVVGRQLVLTQYR